MSKVYGGFLHSEDVQIFFHWWKSFQKQNPTCFHKRLHCNSYANYYNLTLIDKQVYAYLHCCLWVRDYYIFCLMAFTVIFFFPLLHTQIAILITNGRSDDQVDAAARAVADNGISLFAVGECGPWYCEFLQHPHCSGPSDRIWALPAYLQCLQLEIHVQYFWIHWIQCGCLWEFVRLLFLSVWIHASVCTSITKFTNYALR